MKVVTLFGALAALTFATPVLAQNIVADHEQIASVLRENGYKAVISGEEGEEKYISTGTGGTNYTIHFYGCDEAQANCKTVMFYAWFDVDEAPSIENINLYNSRRRWGRVYVDSEGDPTIEMDLDLEDGGMSQELFIDNVEYWDLVLNEFAGFASTGVVPEE